MQKAINPSLIKDANQKLYPDLKSEYDALGEKLSRASEDIETLTQQAAAFKIAIPSWGVGTGGTRFARFPGICEPRNIF